MQRYRKKGILPCVRNMHTDSVQHKGAGLPQSTSTVPQGLSCKSGSLTGAD
jgi:hypothetical protein